MNAPSTFDARSARRSGWLWAIALVGAATAVGAAFRGHLSAPDQVMLYVLGIGISAARFGRGPSLVASALSVVAYGFVFVPPYYTFAIDDERHLLTFATMFAVGLAISSLTLRIRRQESEARERERQTASLYGASRDLAAAADEQQVVEVTARDAVASFGGGAAVLGEDRDGGWARIAASGEPLEIGNVLELARRARASGGVTGCGAADGAPGPFTCVPLRAGDDTLAVLALAPGGGGPLGDDRIRFLEAFARQSALALARVRNAESARSAELRARTEELRSSLLSAVSHDLRTPLAAITGAATTLRQAPMGVHDREELLETICAEAERLERLVRNLLDMTRLQSGALVVQREWVPLEEIVGSALARVEPLLEGRAVRTDLPVELPLVSADPLLLEQVFVNLLENAAKHTPAGAPIEISARVVDGAIEVEVADRGPGIPRGAETAVFETFYRGAGVSSPGAGLGLAICRGIVSAHGGTIGAENRGGGGARFRFVLPQPGLAPPVPSEKEARETGSAP